MIRAVLIGQENLIPYLRGIYPKHRESLERSVKRLAITLTKNVKAKLTGEVLKNRTGILRGSIHYRVDSTPDAVYATVGTNKEYAAVHEFGFHGTVNVKAHLRKIKQAFGRPIPAQEILVGAHSRQANFPERSFIRSALREMETEITTELKRTLSEAVKHG